MSSAERQYTAAVLAETMAAAELERRQLEKDLAVKQLRLDAIETENAVFQRERDVAESRVVELTEAIERVLALKSSEPPHGHLVSNEQARSILARLARVSS